MTGFLASELDEMVDGAEGEEEGAHEMPVEQELVQRPVGKVLKFQPYEAGADDLGIMAEDFTLRVEPHGSSKLVKVTHVPTNCHTYMNTIAPVRQAAMECLRRTVKQLLDEGWPGSEGRGHA